MHLRYEFEIMELGDRIVAVPVGDSVNCFRGVIKMNETAAFVFDLLKEEQTKESILEALKLKYDASEDVLLKELNNYIMIFSERGLLI